MIWQAFLAIIAVFWIVWLASFLTPIAGSWQGQLQVIGFVALVIHIVECIVFQKRLQAHDNGLKQTAMTLLFGFFHIRTLPKADPKAD